MLNYTIANEIYRYLWNEIEHLSLKPGTKLSEAGIGRQFGCSRVPVREVVSRLALERALIIYPQRGSYVTLINYNMVKQVRYLREALETRVVLEAFDKNLLVPIIPFMNSLIKRQQESLITGDYVKCLNLDIEFHRIFYSACDKEFVINHTGYNDIDYLRARLISLKLETKGELMLGQHRLIVNAIEENNREKLENILHEHFTNVLTMIDANKQSNKFIKESFLWN
jgi:DNA-binding GntR family transcriptional regulator